MRDLRNYAARRRRVRPFDHLIKLGNAEAFHDSLLAFRVADHAAVVLDLNGTAFTFFFLIHFFGSRHLGAV